MEMEVEVGVENEKSNGGFDREIVCSVAVKGSGGKDRERRENG